MAKSTTTGSVRESRLSFHTVWIVLTASMLALLGCSKFQDYKVSVEDPTRKERSYDEPYSSHAPGRVLNTH